MLGIVSVVPIVLFCLSACFEYTHYSLEHSYSKTSLLPFPFNKQLLLIIYLFVFVLLFVCFSFLKHLYKTTACV